MTGLANALMMVGLRYGSQEAAERAGVWARQISRAACKTFVGLAREKGSSPLFDRRIWRARCKGCTTYRPNAITGFVLEVKPAEPAPAVAADAVYKLRWRDSERAMYVTVNDVELDGVRRSFEVLVNSKNLEHYAWWSRSPG